MLAVEGGDVARQLPREDRAHLPQPGVAVALLPQTATDRARQFGGHPAGDALQFAEQLRRCLRQALLEDLSRLDVVLAMGVVLDLVRHDADYNSNVTAAQTRDAGNDHNASYRKIAQRELDSMERWRDVQKAVRRAKTYLDLADITWPLGTQQATAADDRRAALDDPSG